MEALHNATVTRLSETVPSWLTSYSFTIRSLSSACGICPLHPMRGAVLKMTLLRMLAFTPERDQAAGGNVPPRASTLETPLAGSVIHRPTPASKWTTPGSDTEAWLKNRLKTLSSATALVRARQRPAESSAASPLDSGRSAELADYRGLLRSCRIRVSNAGMPWLIN